jgi:hypothetical protein
VIKINQKKSTLVLLEKFSPTLYCQLIPMPMKESNRYDKIFKENIDAITMVLVEKVLGILVRDSERLPDELPVTLERKPDQLLKITDRNNETFILHLEFQVADEKEMVERMLE